MPLFKVSLNKLDKIFGISSPLNSKRAGDGRPVKCENMVLFWTAVFSFHLGILVSLDERFICGIRANAFVSLDILWIEGLFLQRRSMLLSLLGF